MARCRSHGCHQRSRRHSRCSPAEVLSRPSSRRQRSTSSTREADTRVAITLVAAAALHRVALASPGGRHLAKVRGRSSSRDSCCLDRAPAVRDPLKPVPAAPSRVWVVEFGEPPDRSLLPPAQMQLQAGQREHSHEWDAQSKGPQNPQAPSAGHTNGEDGDPYAGGDWAVVLPEGFHVFSVHSDRIRRTLLVAVEDLQCALALCDTPVERVMRRIGNRLCSALMVSVVGVAGCGGHAKAAHRSPGSGEVRTPRLSSPVSSVFTCSRARKWPSGKARLFRSRSPVPSRDRRPSSGCESGSCHSPRTPIPGQERPAGRTPCILRSPDGRSRSGRLPLRRDPRSKKHRHGWLCWRLRRLVFMRRAAAASASAEGRELEQLSGLPRLEACDGRHVYRVGLPLRVVAHHLESSGGG